MKPARATLGIALVALVAASALHHVHNAEYLSDYPGMPAWLSRGTVYLAWTVATSLGGLGYVLAVQGRRRAGFVLLALYAAYGLSAFAHYGLAPPAAHGAAMNATIALEALAGAWLLASVAAWYREA